MPAPVQVLDRSQSSVRPGEGEARRRQADGRRSVGVKGSSCSGLFSDRSVEGWSVGRHGYRGYKGWGSSDLGWHLGLVGLCLSLPRYFPYIEVSIGTSTISTPLTTI